MRELKQGYFTGERALFGEHDVKIVDSVFDDGESPLKEGRNLELRGDLFRWKYPLWYCENVDVEACTWFEMARAGVWYTEHMTAEDCAIEAPKNFRRCRDLTLRRVSIPNAAETLWSCRDVRLENVMVKGDYFAMNSEDLEVDGLTLYGNYSFDGVKNAVIRNSRLLTKDAFWNSENITAENCRISGEYLGWNSKDLTLVDCVIESLQGLCFCENLTLIGCRLVNTTLAFEYSTVNADIIGTVDSVKNPLGGVIKCDGIDELIMEKDRVDVRRTEFIIENGSAAV